MKMNPQFQLHRLVRPNILALKPYSCARDEFKGTARAMLDANENARITPYNRYPDPLNLDLKERICRVYGFDDPHRVFLGVGSDECIDMVYRVFCRPGMDNVVAMDPSYGMYGVCADINDIEYRAVSLRADFSLDPEAILAACDDRTKAIFLCSPNNPTGNCIPEDVIEEICDRFPGIVVIDQAYGDFCGATLDIVNRQPNVIVMRTFSKAWGHAGIRLGMAFASREIVDLFNKVKYPYNISMLTRHEAESVLDRADTVARIAREIVEARDAMAVELAKLPIVKKIYPSDANFLLIEVTDANAIYRHLSMEDGIVVRNRNTVHLCNGCLRVTIGTDEENDLLINTLKAYGK